MEASFSPRDHALLEEKIGYKFNNADLLVTALTHSSYSNEVKNREKRDCNERLEFLGDSVLSLIVSDHIYNNLTRFDEGALTRVRAAVVCEGSLHELASGLELGEYMYLGHGELISNGRRRKSILADGFEALLGALYIDGGFTCARDFLLPLILPALENALATGSEDYKSRLQKIVQQTPEELLDYVLTDEQGPPHDRYFTFNVLLNSNVLGTGKGRSKRQAEQNAAREALITLGELEA